MPVAEKRLAEDANLHKIFDNEAKRRRANEDVVTRTIPSSWTSRSSNSLRHSRGTPRRTLSSDARFRVDGTKHPRGVRPWGAFLLLKDAKDGRSPGLGYLANFSDEFICDAILPLLDTRDLCVLAQASRACYVFVYQDDLWRTQTIEQFAGDWSWSGTTWRDTFKSAHVARHHPGVPAPPPDTPLACLSIFSDHLFQPHFCSSLLLSQFSRYAHHDSKPVPIILSSSLSTRPDHFYSNYLTPNLPCVVQGGCKEWPAFQSWRWDSPNFRSQFADTRFKAEGVDVRLTDYLHYAETTRDEAPLYIFDKDFASKMGADGSQATTNGALDSRSGPFYTPPPYFGDDVLELLGTARERPDWRWLIAGPASPPNHPPPGVFPTATGSDVTSPVSLAEWIVNFSAEARKGVEVEVEVDVNGKKERRKERMMMHECVQEEGDVVFVPRGWWHAVLNLTPTIAITQNFLPSTAQHVRAALEFYRDRPEQVSGYGGSMGGGMGMGMVRGACNVDGEAVERGRRLYERVSEVARDRWAEVVEDVQRGDKKVVERYEGIAEVEAKQAVGSLWDALRRVEEGKAGRESGDGGGFAFGFGFDLGNGDYEFSEELDTDDG
ncbi:hypothetical protein HDU93_007599 [Gonapodya sp. JEL0774]|nr:hypothetical protein HDU93_007599 [Gonapodya sp. JEL0774]